MIPEFPSIFVVRLSADQKKRLYALAKSLEITPSAVLRQSLTMLWDQREIAIGQATRERKAAKRKNA